MTEKIVSINQEIEMLKQMLEDVKGTETEVYSRIVGYYQPLHRWNRGKKEEFKIRLNYKYSMI